MSKPLAWLRLALKILLSAFMITAGVSHFTNPEFFLKIMPPYIPAHQLMVDLSGIAEILLGVGLLLPIPKLSRLSAWGLIALYVAVFPANIHAYLHRAEIFPDVPEILQLIRLPLQGVLILWAWWYTRPVPGDVSPDSSPAAAS